MAKSNEPIWWSLFSAGGVVAAFFMPITMVLTSIAVPSGWLPAETLRQLVAHPLARLYLLVLISLPMFHFAHRFRYVAVDLGLKHVGGIVAIACYGSAILATILALFVLAFS